MNGKEFLEVFDPQIKEVGYDNYSYTPNQVIQRLDAFKKQLLLHNVVGQSEQLSKRPNTSSTWECFTKEEKQQKGNF